MYDVVIIGAGVSGSACARELSKYNLSICVVEKEEDVCCGTSKANSAIVHSGIDCKTGQPFVEEVMPKWIWVFWAIYIADFFLFLGGALGGAINAAAAIVTGSIAMKKNTGTGVKVILCIVFCVIVTLVEILGAYAIIGTRM